MALFLLSSHSLAETIRPIRCQQQEVSKNQVAAINIGFSEYSPGHNIPGVQGDLRHFARLSHRIASRITTITSEARLPKQNLLEGLRRAAESKQYLMLNYAGHGIISPSTNTSYMVLPGFYEIADCRVHEDPATLPQCRNLLISGEEVRAAVGDTRVFGIFEKCHAGGFNLGLGNNLIYSARSNEEAAAGHPKNGSHLSRTMAATVEENSCNNDLDGDGRLSLYETFASVEPLTRMQEEEEIGAIFEHERAGTRGGWEIPIEPIQTEIKRSENQIDTLLAHVPGLNQRDGFLSCIYMSEQTNTENCDTPNSPYRVRTLREPSDFYANISMDRSNCRLNLSDRVLLTGRRSGSYSQVQVARSQNPNCRQMTGWVETRLLADPTASPSAITPVATESADGIN